MTFNQFVSGVNTSFSSQLNQNFTSLSKHTLKGRLTGVVAFEEKVSDLDTSNTGVAYVNTPKQFVEDDGFTYNYLWRKSDTTYVDTTNSTCLYSESGLVAFCDVLDLFDDGSISSAIWSTSGTTGAPSEGSGRLTVGGSGTNINAAAISNGSSGLDIHGQDAEVLIDYEWTASTPGSTPGTFTAAIQLSNGSTHVTLFNFTPTGTSQSRLGRGIVRIVYKHSDTTCDVYFRPYQVTADSTTANDTSGPYVLGEEYEWQTNISVSTVTTNKYIRFLSTTGNNGGTSTLYAYGIGYRKNGAGSGDSDLVFNKTLLSSASKAIFSGLWVTKPSSNPTAVFSTDGSTTYGSDDCWEAWGDAPSAGTSMKARIRVAKPTTIDANSKNIPVLLIAGALYE